MCKKSKCAYLRDNGYCLMHKELCRIQHPDARCPDAVARVILCKSRYLWNFKIRYNLKTAKGRFQFYTRYARGQDVYRECTSKRRYNNIRDAKRTAAKCVQSRGIPLFVYECPFCRGYHLTHKARWSPLGAPDRQKSNLASA